ncbi:hypothetical protein KHD22_001401 [Campylobacter coli]|nr:hypothetical protein [Campylobacter coli]
MSDKEQLQEQVSILLSYPKVAKNVEAEYNPQQQGYDWKVRANDGSTIRYGSKEYQDTNKQNINRLLMGDVGIRNDSGTNVIYHANISSKRNFERLAKKKQVAVGEAVLSLHTSRPAELGGNNQRLSGANAHSTTTNKEIITETTNENQANISNLESNNQPKKPIDFQAKLKEFTENKLQNKNPSKDKERGR